MLYIQDLLDIECYRCHSHCSYLDTLLLLKGFMMDILHAKAIGTVASFDVVINGYYILGMDILNVSSWALLYISRLLYRHCYSHGHWPCTKLMLLYSETIGVNLLSYLHSIIIEGPRTIVG